MKVCQCETVKVYQNREMWIKVCQNGKCDSKIVKTETVSNVKLSKFNKTDNCETVKVCQNRNVKLSKFVKTFTYETLKSKFVKTEK